MEETFPAILRISLEIHTLLITHRLRRIGTLTIARLLRRVRERACCCVGCHGPAVEFGRVGASVVFDAGPVERVAPVEIAG